jgi:imidazolonepropionase-like amidohydrolase
VADPRRFTAVHDDQRIDRGNRGGTRRAWVDSPCCRWRGTLRSWLGVLCALASALLAAVVVFAAPQALPTIVIYHATIIDGTGGPVIRDGAIVIEGERIRQIGPRGGITRDPRARVIDATGKFVIPGLIDAHVHFDQSADLFTRPDAVDLRRIRAYAEELAWTRQRLPVTLMRYLASGVTSVVDMGGPVWTFELRDRANATNDAPRVAVAGPLISTAPELRYEETDPPVIVADTPDMARELVRRNAARHPDLTKILFIRGGGDIDRQFAVVNAAADESHALGIRVAVHATELETAKLALRAGADILVHSVEDRRVDREFIDLAKSKHVLYISTLIVNEGYDEVFGRAVKLTDIERRLGDPAVIATWSQLGAIPADEIPGGVPSANLRATQETQFLNLRLVEAAGIRIAAGTDAGNIGTLHGPALHREFELMAAAGIRPPRILVAATRNAAAVMGRDAELGTLERGKYADLVILDADPTRDIHNARAIFKVIKDGAVIDIAPAALE